MSISTVLVVPLLAEGNARRVQRFKLTKAWAVDLNRSHQQRLARSVAPAQCARCGVTGFDSELRSTP